MVENLGPRKRKAVVDLCDSNLKQDVNKDLKHFSCALISDEWSYDKGSIFVFSKALLNDVSKMIPFKKVYYWSDFSV